MLANDKLFNVVILITDDCVPELEIYVLEAVITGSHKYHRTIANRDLDSCTNKLISC